MSAKDPNMGVDTRLKLLYPMVNESETPLPRAWSTKDKYNYIGLSMNNLRVQYKGHGKTHKDASSVRATHPIPASCGLYYFEVRIVSKGRDGYMGVGLSAQGVNMNRLPGWDKHSYGYHGDDGHSFCSSGTGQAYGPTFTTGDVIGCGLDLVDGSCFYTKNGHHLGIAFRDLPPNLYPTVGLQTPGEVVDANFGQEPFLFDLEGEMIERRSRIREQIDSHPTPGRHHGDWQTVMHRMVASYLVHHGFSETAEAFRKNDAVSTENKELDGDLAGVRDRQTLLALVMAGRMGEAIRMTDRLYPDMLTKDPDLLFRLKVRQFIEMVSGCDDVEEDHVTTNGNNHDCVTNGNNDQSNNNSMEVDNSSSSSSSSSSTSPSVIANPSRFDKLITFGQNLQILLSELQETKSAKDFEANAKLMQDAFSLLAYADPWSSPVGWQLERHQREAVADSLNSAILEAKGLPKRPPVEVALTHTKQLLRLMANSQLGSCAFAGVEDFIR